jgi:SecD/SecF fusion protein
MNRNNLWKLVIVVAVLVWAFIEMYPPVGRNLAEFFQEKAIDNRKDAAYTNIVKQLTELQQANPQRGYGNLVEAVGTNDITNYFPFYDVSGERNPSRAVLDHLQHDAAGKIKLGLDLQGGTAFVVGLDTNYLTETGTNKNTTADQRRQNAVSEAVEVLRKRVDKFGVAEPIIQPEGNDRILIQLPGLSESDKVRARENIRKAAHLTLQMVHPNSKALIDEGLPEPGYEILSMSTPSRDGQSHTIEQVLVKKKVEMTGEHITWAGAQRDDVGQPEIEFSLDPEGTQIFGKLTRENVGQRMGIVLDGELLSAPNIHEPIENGSCRISGSFTDQEAIDLANALQNPLAVPLRILSESSVDPTLGADTVKSGITSAIVGTLAVAGFMVCYYLLAGAVADVALITNIIILLGVMCSIGTTLTLPGIAGVVLTIGMAVDANVLIFERIREESAKGKSLRGALSAGYDRAFSTIFDSHVTTLISSVILIYMGTGPIKGFGMTLTIGVAASLFTALVVTRLIFDFLISRGIVKSLPMLHIIRATKLDFMKLAKPAFALSWTIILIGLAYGIFVRGDGMLGIDFKGGDNMTLTFKQKVDADQIRAALKGVPNVKDPIIQYQKDATSTNELLRITTDYNTSSNVLSTITNTFASAGFTSKGSEAVGPTIGSEIQKTAIVASLLSLFGILIYVAIRYEFSFAVGAVVAVIHDVLMTIGCYCLTGLFGAEHAREFNATMVAAILTIIGFSINDTIVIFDRIREDLKLGVRGSFKDVINQALNQTLSRTLITSGTVFIATTSLYFLGGGAINDFAFTFLIGIITGTYSSIYIASALVLWWHKGQRPTTSNAQMAVENTAVARPNAR